MFCPAVDKSKILNNIFNVTSSNWSQKFFLELNVIFLIEEILETNLKNDSKGILKRLQGQIMPAGSGLATPSIGVSFRLVALVVNKGFINSDHKCFTAFSTFTPNCPFN